MKTQRLRHVRWLLKVMQVRTQNLPSLGLHEILSKLQWLDLPLTQREWVWGKLIPPKFGNSVQGRQTMRALLTSKRRH